MPGMLCATFQDKLIFNHSTFDDFSKGTVSNSGHNLFVSRKGQIRFINWFDLDNDGYPEILFANFLHGWDGNHFPAFIYWGESVDTAPHVCLTCLV